MKSLIVGLGIGQLYRDVLTRLGAEVYTVDMDPAKNADFKTIEEAVASNNRFDTLHVCTPNFTHRKVYEAWLESNPDPNSIAFIEKPGFASSKEWAEVAGNAPTRIMMVKNNQYRKNIYDMQDSALVAKNLSLRWINKDRVPSPGSWFTTKELAYSGVSRDLMPHLLSYIPMFFPYTYKDFRITVIKDRRYELDELTKTDYGTVNPNGRYDVDDYCRVWLSGDNRYITLIADWRSLDKDDIALDLGTDRYELGLCPEEAYAAMIQKAVDNKDNSEFWVKQYEQDLWIHQIIEVHDAIRY